MGTAGRADQINFEYSANATDLNTGTWTGVPALKLHCRRHHEKWQRRRQPDRAQLQRYAGHNGATVWIRWTDVDVAGHDGLAVDDFSLTPRRTGAPSGSGSSSPNPVAGSSTNLTANITPGVSPASTSIAVACNLAAIGGSASFDLPNSTGNTYSAAYSVPAATAASTYALPCTVSDAQGRSGHFNISLTVTSSSTPPTATGTATPNPITAGNSVAFSATPVSGANPSSASFWLAI